MKKIVITLTAAIVFAWQGMSFAASSVDALIQKLEDKGILTDQDANQIKGEIASSEKTSQEMTFKSLLPDWLNGFKLSGDFRYRVQTNYRAIPLTAAKTFNFRQTRSRIRARLNFEDQVNDKFKMVVGIATDGGNPRSNNYTLGGSKAAVTGITNVDTFGKPQVILNKAYGVYTPWSWLTITGGKMDNPFWEPGNANAAMLFDPDITPEGVVLKLEKKLTDHITPYIQTMYFDLHDLSPTTAVKTDPFMLITQGGLKGNITDRIYYKSGFSWIDFNNPSHFLSTQTTGTNTTVTVAGTTMLKYNYNDVLVGALEFGMNDPFGEMLPYPFYVPQIGVFGDFAYNNAAHDQENKAWMAGFYLGNSSVSGWGTWRLQSFYKAIQRDAWLDTLPNDDFYSGDTDTRGWQSQLDIGLAKNVWFDILYFRTEVLKHLSTIAAFKTKAPENLFQMDVNIKF